MSRTMMVLLGLGLLGAFQNGYLDFLRKDDFAYNEVRMVMKVGSRAVEAVAYIKRPKDEDCDKVSNWFFGETMECKEPMTCTLKENSCSDSVPDRYQSMFDQQPATTTYLSAKARHYPREAVMVFWGLSLDEAGYACEAAEAVMLQNYKVTTRCV